MTVSHDCEQAMIRAFNGLGDVVDILQVLDMAIASEEGANPFQALATVLDVARLKATEARAEARQGLDLLKAGDGHG